MKKPRPFGKYYLLERINVGGMAEVFRAKVFGSDGFERFVAIKRILPNIAEDEEFITMFIDEAKISVRLTHPNIAQVIELNKVDDVHYIAMEFISGKDIRTIFDVCRSKKAEVSIAQACFIAMKVCEGLDYAHHKKDDDGREIGIVHRDVSPQNILISYEGDVKIIDFGIAKAMGKASKTQAGILKGKFGYMSPEQVRNNQVDKRSDVFSLGIVLYEMLTNERLFIGENDFSTLQKVRDVEILPPSTYNRNIPEQLEAIVLKALAKNPEDRYQTAGEFHDELQAFMYSSGVFYSRKDLSAWMKKNFAKDIKEEAEKIKLWSNKDFFKNVEGPSSRQSSSGRSMGNPYGNSSDLSSKKSGNFADSVSGEYQDPRAYMPPGRKDKFEVSKPKNSSQKSDTDEWWDEDEDMETNIYDKPAPSKRASQKPALSAGRASKPTADLFGGSSGKGGGSLFDDFNDDTDAGIEPVFSFGDSPKKSSPVAAVSKQTSKTINVDAPLSPKPAASKVSSDSGNKKLLIAVTLLFSMILAAVLVWYFVFRSHSQNGWIELKIKPSNGVTVKINGQILKDKNGRPITNFPVKISKVPGNYKIEINKKGFVSYTKMLNLQANYTIPLDVILKKANIKIYIEGIPDKANVEIDGRPYKEPTPWNGMEFPAGAHKIVIKKKGFYPFVHTEVKKAGEGINIAYKLLPQKVAVTVGLVTKKATICLLEDPKVMPDVRTQCKIKPNTPYIFEPLPTKKYYLKIFKDKYEPYVIPVDFSGKTVWSPPTLISLKPIKKNTVSPTAVVNDSMVPEPVMKTVISVMRTYRPPVMMRPRIIVRMMSSPMTRPMSSGGSFGYLRIGSRPRSMVFVDGAQKGWTPKKLKLSPGRHRVTLINNAKGLRKSFSVHIAAGKSTTKVVRF